MNARLGAAGYSRPWRAVAGRCMLGSVADEQDTHVAPITRTQAGRHRRTGGAGQHVQFDGRVSAKPPPLLAHCDSEDRPRSGAADRVVSGGWALIAAAISAGCATAERTALDAANEVEDQHDQQDDHEDPDQPEARTSDCKQHPFRPLVGMKYIQPTARAAKRPYPGARLYTLVPTARENPDVVNAHRFPRDDEEAPLARHARRHQSSIRRRRRPRAQHPDRRRPPLQRCPNAGTPWPTRAQALA